MKKRIAALVAACMLLAVMAPAVAAADYQKSAQFMGYFERNNVTNTIEDTKPGGYTYVNPDAQLTTVADAVGIAFRTTHAPGPDDWPQFHYNVKHDGYSPSTGLPSDNSSAWSKYFPVIGTVNPIIANGKVFILTGYAGFDEPAGLTTINLTCLDESDPSQILWNFTLPRTIHWGSWAAPATDGDYVYVSSDDKHYAINVTTGEEVWNFTGFSYVSNGGPAISDDMVFLSDSGDYSIPLKNGTYYGLNKANGALRWTFNWTNANPVFKYSQASPAYDATDNSVYVTGYNADYNQGYLYKVNATTGVQIWSNYTATGVILGGSASFDTDNVYVTSYLYGGNGKLYAYSKDTSVLKWSKTIAGTDATPAIANGLVYVSGGTAGSGGSTGVYAYYTDGTLAWRKLNAGMGGWTDSVSVANGYAFVGHENSTYPIYSYDSIYALNATTGATVWFYPQGGATAAIANSKVYTNGNNGYLYRFG
ncbi:MAG: PQQ-binding-like beta-propeller repeat protein [Methanoregula sp.]|jgi:outer membrane protein assembly factor BamB|uniref:PQQ-binding-like beta-propeller repeat protein n=1 Tax=Methanoregula sp. TaxID=2052170 RepID=UPI0025D94172|nr:PQQ-binding-like beta-propeller repeat protein [Methanoregula sp.]MCK9632664.1 PQQ-binding-like beta-propeller repeat protein [Methanoregula sp.]